MSSAAFGVLEVLLVWDSTRHPLLVPHRPSPIGGLRIPPVELPCYRPQVVVALNRLLCGR